MGLQRVGKDDIQFSLLYTAIGYPNISSYIGLQNSQDYKLDSLDIDHTRDLFNWLFMQDEHGRKAVPESRKIATLNTVLSSVEATEIFIKTRDLEAAYPFTNGPQEFFNSSLRNMENTIQQMISVVHSEALIPRESDLHNIEKLSDSLDDLARKVRRALKTSMYDAE